MGNSLPKVWASKEDTINGGVHLADYMITVHHVSNGGCIEEFLKATKTCNPDYDEQRRPDTLMERWRRSLEPREEHVVDKEACVKATAALRQCFAGNPTMFQHHYLSRMDKMLDEDLNPSPEMIKKQSVLHFRWWTGMRRS